MRFACTLCGDCCTGAQVVRLTGSDLDLLVRRLGLPSVLGLRTQGLVAIVREPLGDRSVWRPRIRFRTRPLHQCPFLINEVSEDGIYRGLCSLHPDFKPLVCSLSPLAREVEDSGIGPVAESWSLVPPVDGCPGFGRGEPLTLATPGHLVLRLADEVKWMRWLINEGSLWPDEEVAWAQLANGPRIAL